MPPQGSWQILLVCAVAHATGTALHGQEIHIRVLDAHNGKPVTNECPSIWLGRGPGAYLSAHTNKQGVVVLHLENGKVTAEAVSPRECNGAPILGPLPLLEDRDTIRIAGNYYVACQKYETVVPGGPPTAVLPGGPRYSIKNILESGVSAANTCGKFRTEAKPGELIVFVRRRSFLEGWRL